VTIHVRQTSPSASEAIIRGHRIAIDRPVEKGGTDKGPMGGELFLAAIGGCFMSNLLAAIKTREARVSDVHTEVIGTPEGTPPRFSGVELNVSANSDDMELVPKLVEIAERGCIMLNTLRGILPVTVRIVARV
jgi:putative redox protein